MDCKFSNESVSGNTKAADVSCTKPLRSEGRITVVAESPDSFAITHDLRMEFGGVMQPVSMKTAYRRLGDCE